MDGHVSASTPLRYGLNPTPEQAADIVLAFKYSEPLRVGDEVHVQLPGFSRPYATGSLQKMGDGGKYQFAVWDDTTSLLTLTVLAVAAGS